MMTRPAARATAPATLDWLLAYANAGGHLPDRARGTPTPWGAPARTPSRLAAAAGVRYQEFANLEDPVGVRAPALGPGSFQAVSWAEYLEPDGADVLACYDHPHLSRWPAVTTRGYGRGRITVVGTVPDQELARALLAWVAPSPVHGWTRLPASVRVTTATRPDGGRLAFVHHWGWGDVSVPAPGALVDVLDPRVRLTADERLELGPWDVRVLATGTSTGPGDRALRTSRDKEQR